MQSAAVFIQQLSEHEGAPDTYLRPYRAATGVRWTLEVGSPYLDGGVVRLPVAEPGVKSAVTGLKVQRDYMGQRTGIFVLGQGSEADMLVGTAGSDNVPVAAGIPWLDSTVAYKQVTSVPALNSLGVAALASSVQGVEQWDFQVHLEHGGRVKSAQLRPGARLLIDHPGNARIRKGRYVRYVLSVKSDGGFTRSLATQEVP